jgi:hypothetical protein
MVASEQDFFSTAYVATWPRFGTLVSGRLYRQPTLAHRIAAIASGSSALMNSEDLTESWATPRSGAVGSTRTPSGNPAKDGKILDQQVREEAVLVPRAVSQDWPTSTSRDYKGARTPETFAKTGRNAMTNSLADAVEIGPPRTASGPPVPDSGSTGGKVPESSGKLNPSWVENLMGFPTGHTQLPTKFVKPRKETP